MHAYSVVHQCPIVEKAEGGSANTSANTRLVLNLRVGVGVVRFHYLFLVPLVILGMGSQALLGLNIPIAILLIMSGLAGNLYARKQLSVFTSILLLSLLVWGRVADDLLKTRPPDTAVFLVEFGMALFLMEANSVLLEFETMHKMFEAKTDEVSKALEARLIDWLRHQFSLQGRIAVGSIGISLVLLPLAGLTSVGSQQLPLTGALLLAAIIALLFLITYRREPEVKPGRRQ